MCSRFGATKRPNEKPVSPFLFIHLPTFVVQLHIHVLACQRHLRFKCLLSPGFVHLQPRIAIRCVRAPTSDTNISRTDANYYVLRRRATSSSSSSMLCIVLKCSYIVWRVAIYAVRPFECFIFLSFLCFQLALDAMHRHTHTYTYIAPHEGNKIDYTI